MDEPNTNKLDTGSLPQHRPIRHHQPHHSGRPHPDHQHRRHSHYGESLSYHLPEGSYHHGTPRTHHGGHYPSEQQYHRDHHRRDHHHDENHPMESQVSVPPKSHSVTDPHAGNKRSSWSLATASRFFRSHLSSKSHLQETSKDPDTKDKPYARRKSRAQRGHKKLNSGKAFQWLWEKISRVIQNFRKIIWTLTQTLAFETFIFLIVCLNTVMLVTQTFTELEIRGDWHFMVVDNIFLCIYIVEALVKIIALGLDYFYDPWNKMDFFITAMAVLDFVLLQLNSLSYSFYNHSLFLILQVFKSLRALRAIRVLRKLSILAKLQEMTDTLSRSLPFIMAIFIIIFTCLYLFSVVLWALFRRSDPSRFQNIFTTLFTLFAMLTLDDWSLIYTDSRANGAWYIILILMIYIIIQCFIFLNLVIIVLVDNFQVALLKDQEKMKLEKAAHEKLLEDSLTELSQSEAGEKLSESTLQMRFIERKFGTMTEKQQELHFQFLQLMASVEQHQQKFRSQASVIDEIVDTAFETGEKDYEK